MPNLTVPAASLMGSHPPRSTEYHIHPNGGPPPAGGGGGGGGVGGGGGGGGEL